MERVRCSETGNEMIASNGIRPTNFSISCVFGKSMPRTTSKALMSFSTHCWAWNPMVAVGHILPSFSNRMPPEDLHRLCRSTPWKLWRVVHDLAYKTIPSWAAGYSIVPTTSFRQQKSSGVLIMISFAIAKSCRATPISTIF